VQMSLCAPKTRRVPTLEFQGLFFDSVCADPVPTLLMVMVRGRSAYRSCIIW
jgi:hypothetical protein